MEVDQNAPYHPTLRTLCNAWLRQPMTKRSVNFLLYVAVLHKDEKLARWCVAHNADPSAKAEKWYVRFLGNYI